MGSGRLRFFLGGLSLLVLCVAGPSFGDGTQTGVITGTVIDVAGTPVEGVTVNLSGSQLERRAVTDEAGRFRFPALSVGDYSVIAELLGLRSRSSDVMVFVNKTSELRLELRQSSEPTPAPKAEDWIRAVAAAPMIDRFETRVGANVSFDFLEDLPVERFYQSVALLLPGVAGGEDGNPNTSGALRSGNLFLVDGVDTTDPTTGLFGLNLAYEAVKQVEVTTAAAPISYGRASGALINVVTRSGGPNHEGLARWVMTSNDWNDPYDYPENLVPHLQPELAAANSGPDDLDSTLTLRLGGPVWSDRLFFSAAWENSSTSFLRPTAFLEDWDEGTEVESGAFKLTAQLASAHTLVGQHTFDSASFTTFAPFDVQPAENSLPQISTGTFSDPLLTSRPGEIFSLEDRTADGDFTKLQWNAVLGQNLSFALNLAQQERELDRAARNSRGLSADAPHIAEVLFDFDGEIFTEFFFLNGITEEGFEKRPRDQANLAVDYFMARAVDHEFSFGVDYQQTDSETLLNVPGQAGVDRLTGRAVSGQLFIDFDENCDFNQGCRVFDPFSGQFLAYQMFNFWRRPLARSQEQTLALYASDTISFDRWLFRFGLRFESVTGDDREGSLVDDEDLAPRIAVSYDPRGDGKVLLQAAWGRYYEPFLQQYLASFGLFEAFSGFTRYAWAGNPDTFFIELGIFDPACFDADPTQINHPCWVPLFAEAPTAFQPASRNPSLDRASVDELVLSFERRLSPQAGLSIHYVDRRWNDLWDDRFDVDENAQLISEVAPIPGARRSYEAVQLLLQKRFADHWQLLASYTWSEAQGNIFSANGLDSFADFSFFSDTNLVNRFGPAPYDRPHQFRLYGTYLFPFERFGIILAAALRYQDGTPFEQTTLETIELPGEDFGPLGMRYLTPRGSERLSGVFQLDTAVNVDIRLAGEVELEVKGEIFNLTGENEQLGATSNIDFGLFALPRSLGDLQRPRSYRLTLGLRF